jgi:hypothetical protein
LTAKRFLAFTPLAAAPCRAPRKTAAPTSRVRCPAAEPREPYERRSTECATTSEIAVCGKHRARHRAIVHHERPTGIEQSCAREHRHDAARGRNLHDRAAQQACTLRRRHRQQRNRVVRAEDLDRVVGLRVRRLRSSSSAIVTKLSHGSVQMMASTEPQACPTGSASAMRARAARTSSPADS